MRTLRVLFVVMLALLSGGFAIATGGGGAGGAAAVPSCSGEAIPRPGGGYMACTFDDEFTGTTLNTSRWIPMTGTSWHSGSECFVESPQTLGVANGLLRLSINETPRALRCGNRMTRFWSGMVTSRTAQTYGRFEIRAQLAGGPALQDALWLYPVKTLGPWPTSGEIDLAEMFGLYPTQVLPHLHYLAPNGRKAPGTFCDMSNAATTFHTYTLDWTASSIRFLYDGQLCFQFGGWLPHGPQVAPAPFNAPFALNLTLSMAKSQRIGAVAHTAWPSSMYIDYVRVWK